MFDLNDMIRWVFETGTITEHEKLAYITMYAVLAVYRKTKLQSLYRNVTVVACHL